MLTTCYLSSDIIIYNVDDILLTIIWYTIHNVDDISLTVIWYTIYNGNEMLLTVIWYTIYNVDEILLTLIRHTIFKVCQVSPLAVSWSAIVLDVSFMFTKFQIFVTDLWLRLNISRLALFSMPLSDLIACYYCNS